MILSLLLSSCHPNGDWFGEISVTRKDTLIIDNGAEPETLDPNKMKSHSDGNIANQIFEGLTRYHPKTLRPLPRVAKSWKISNGFRKFIFYLRKNAKWSSGRRVTAHDFVYSWRRLLAPATASSYSYFLFAIKNAVEYNRGKIKDPSKLGIKAIDDHTLIVTLKNPTPYFLDLTSFSSTYPVPRETVEKHGDRWTRPENIICNGPFMLSEWKMHRHIILKKNTKYWDKDVVKLKKVVFYPIEDQGSKLNLYRSGEIDYASGYPTEMVPFLKKKKDMLSHPGWGTYYYKINVTVKPLNKKIVRQALSMAIDRETIVYNLLKQGQLPAYSLTPPYFKAYQPAMTDKYNPLKAKALLAKAGFKNGKGFPKLIIMYNTSENHKHIAEVLQKMWEKNLNIKVSLENQEWKVYLKTTEKMEYQICRMGWIGDYLDPATFLDIFMEKKGNNNTGWYNRRYISLMNRALRSFDIRKRYSLMKKAEKILMDELPIIPIYFYTYNPLIKPYVRGIYGNLRDEHPLREVWIDPDWRKNK